MGTESDDAPGLVEKRFLSRGEAAQRLGVPPRTIHRWACEGKLPCVRTFGGHRRFAVADIDAMAILVKRRRQGYRMSVASAGDRNNASTSRRGLDFGVEKIKGVG
jgi:excisionase family DNA binding protein